MQVNHDATRQILFALEDLINPELVEVTTNNLDYLGRPSGSDYVTLEKTSHIGFEVFADEIRVEFFDDHTHFGRNYNFDEDAKLEEFVQQATAFLRQLFSQTLVKLETYRGRIRTRYEWFFLCPDGRKESIGGPWFAPLFTFVNPFRRKTFQQTHLRFHKETGTFVRIGDGTVSVHSYDWDIMIEISRTNGVYTYSIHRYFYDEEMAVFYWVPVQTPGASLFDTESNALKHAKEAANSYCAANRDRSIS